MRRDILAAEVAEWMRRSANDLRAAALDIDADMALLEDAVFHCQQAVEKSLKGFLIWGTWRPRKTHDIAELAELVRERDPDLGDLARRAAMLTDYAWCYRYPTDVDEPTREEAIEALELARAVVEAVERRVVRP